MAVGTTMESMIMKMANTNCSNKKNLTSLMKLEASARPRMSREPIEKIMVRIMPRMPWAVFIMVSVTTLSMNPSYADPYFFP
jgi:hypothetical protein